MAPRGGAAASAMPSESARRDEPAAAETGREGRWTLPALVALTILVHATSFQEGHNWGGDFAFYIHQAKALVDGTTGELNALAIFRVENSTSQEMVGPLYYPWGFPLLLAPVYALFGLSLPAMKLLLLAFIAGIQVTTFLLLRRRLPGLWVALIAFMMGINPVFFQMKNSIISDLPFCFFVLWTLVLIQRIVVDRRPLTGAVPDQILLGLALLCAILTRTHGLALIPALALVQASMIWNGREDLTPRGALRALRRARTVQLLPYVTFALGMGAASAALPVGEGSYLASGHFAYGGIGAFLGQLAYNLAYYAWLPSKFLGLSVLGTLLQVAVLLPLALLGVCRRLWPDRLLAVFAACHMAVLLVYPWQDLRFILPVIPIYLYFAVAGAIEGRALLARRFPRLAAGPSLAAVVFLPLAVYFAADTALAWAALARDPGFVRPGPYRAESRELFGFLRDNTPDAAVFNFMKPRVLTLYTGRRAILTLEPDEVIDGRADHLLLYTGESKSQAPARVNARLCAGLEAHPERFALIFRNRDFLLYRIRAESGAPVPLPDACASFSRP